MTINQSKCCSQPVLTASGEEGTWWHVCLRCKKGCDTKVVTRYTASTKLTRPKPLNPMYLIAFLVIMFSLIGILVALSAR